MTLATLLISIVSLAISVALFWRFHRVMRSRTSPEVQEIAARQKELVAVAKESLEHAYDHVRQNLADARELLRRVREVSRDAGERHLRLAGEHLERLTEVLDDGFRAVGRVTISAARRTEEAIAARVRHLKVRATLLLAETKAHAAREAVMDQRFTSAEELLEEAADLIRRASDDLAGEPRYGATVESIRRALREAIVALRAHAEITIKRMDHLLAENTRLVEQLESDEARVTPMRAPKLASTGAPA